MRNKLTLENMLAIVTNSSSDSQVGRNYRSDTIDSGMSIAIDRSRVSVDDLVSRSRSGMIPLSNTFSYFSATPIAEDDLKQYTQDPVSALPPLLIASLPRVEMILVPYLEKGNGKTAEAVCFEKPQENRQLSRSRRNANGVNTLLFPIKDREMADYHYTFYNAIASVIAENGPADSQEAFFRLLREELASEVHGEVDQRSWHLKQSLLRRQSNARRETKLFRDYALQSLEDTLTLYLHGICCDIDVETGPRQMPSRYLRKRLELLFSLYPPPEGYAVFPEHVKNR